VHFFSRSASLLWLDVVVFAQTLKIALLEKNEHCTRPGREAKLTSLERWMVLARDLAGM
jgi:hypothetical protein